MSALPNKSPSGIDEAMECAVAAYNLHRQMGLDLNQPAAVRQEHQDKARLAAGEILELFDLQGD
jgi:hypothetical protein